VLAERLGQLGEGDRGHREVVDELRLGPKRLTRLAQHVQQAAGVVGVETAAREEHMLGK
jgi:hypothetical protein